MNKKILTFCTIVSITAAFFACKKEDDKKTETPTTTTTSTTSTTSTTATTSTTSTSTAVPGVNQIAIDTVLVNVEVSACAAISQGRYSMKANQVGNMANTIESIYGKAPSFSNAYTITPGLPAIGNTSQVQITAVLNTVSYVAQSGTANAIKTADSSGIKFSNITFKASNDSTTILSGFIKCP